MRSLLRYAFVSLVFAFGNCSIAPLSVALTRKDLYDGHKIFGELLLGFGVGAAIEDAELGSGSGKDGFDEIDPKPGETVAVGHDNLWDASLHALFHHHGESSPFKIDTRGNIGDDFVFWKLLVEEGDLSNEVIFLDASVDVGTGGDTLPSWSIVDDLCLFRDKSFNVIESVTTGRSETFDAPPFCPVAERLCFSCATGGHKRGGGIHRALYVGGWVVVCSLQIVIFLKDCKRKTHERLIYFSSQTPRKFDKFLSLVLIYMNL